jgi:hypothetical protein
MPEIIDPVFTKTSQNARFLLSENERFGLVFVKTGSINSGTGIDSQLGGPVRNPICRILARQAT